MKYTDLLKPSTSRCPAPRALALITVLAITAWTTPQADADTITTSAGITVNDVFIDQITNGELVFRTRGGQQTRALSDLKLISIDGLDAYTQGQQALIDKKPRAAVGPLNQALRAAKQDWQRHLIQASLVKAHDALGNPAEAVRAYAALAQSGADDYFLQSPPTTSVQAAPEAQHANLTTLLTAARRNAAPTAQPFIEQMLAAVAPAEQPGTGDTPQQAGTSQGPSGQGTASTPAGTAESAVVLPAGVPADLEIVKKLKAGDFENAVQDGLGMVTNANRLSTSLYLLGRAQLGIADKTGKQEDYLTAGVTFMRVIAHFQRLRSPEVGAAMVEAGYVHQKIGRPDIAAKLFQAASPLLSEDEQPAYAQRLADLRSSLGTNAPQDADDQDAAPADDAG